MSQCPQTFFFFLNESKSLETFRPGLLIRDKFPVRPKDCGGLSDGAPVAGAAVFRLFFFLPSPPDQRLWQKKERRGWRRGRGRRIDPYRMLSTGQWIFPAIQMYLRNAWVIHYSRFWSVTMDLRNEWCYLFADFISLILLIPLACVPLLIRK